MAEGTWDTRLGIWGGKFLTPLNDVVLGVDRDNHAIYSIDPQDLTSEFTALIERVGFPLDGHEAVTTIVRIIPFIDGTAPVFIQIGAQDYIGGPIRWGEPKEFDPTTDHKVEVRSTGKYHCWRIFATGQTNWKFSGMDIQYVVNGER